MQAITVTFDRIFDVVGKTSDIRNRDTLFSFEAGGVREYGVHVVGHPTLHDGMTVTAILEKPDNWQSLVCWKDHRTGEIAFGGHGSLPLRIFLMAWFVIVVAGNLYWLSRQSPWLASCGALVLLGFVAAETVAIRRLVQACRSLRQYGPACADAHGSA